jgi:hypothetical protein
MASFRLFGVELSAGFLSPTEKAVYLKHLEERRHEERLAAGEESTVTRGYEVRNRSGSCIASPDFRYTGEDCPVDFRSSKAPPEQADCDLNEDSKPKFRLFGVPISLDVSRSPGTSAELHESHASSLAEAGRGREQFVDGKLSGHPHESTAGKRPASQGVEGLSNRRRVMLFGVDITKSAVEQTSESLDCEFEGQAGCTETSISDLTFIHETNFRLHSRPCVEKDIQSSSDSSSAAFKHVENRGFGFSHGTDSSSPIQSRWTASGFNCENQRARDDFQNREETHTVPKKRKLRQILLCPIKSPKEDSSKKAKKDLHSSDKKIGIKIKRKLDNKPVAERAEREVDRANVLPFGVADRRHTSPITEADKICSARDVIDLSNASQTLWWTTLKKVLALPSTTITFGLLFSEATGTELYSRMRKISPLQRKAVLKQVSWLVPKLGVKKRERAFTNDEDFVIFSASKHHHFVLKNSAGILIDGYYKRF